MGEADEEALKQVLNPRNAYLARATSNNELPTLVRQPSGSPGNSDTSPRRQRSESSVQRPRSESSLSSRGRVTRPGISSLTPLHLEAHNKTIQEEGIGPKDIGFQAMRSNTGSVDTACDFPRIRSSTGSIDTSPDDNDHGVTRDKRTRTNNLGFGHCCVSWPSFLCRICNGSATSPQFFDMQPVAKDRPQKNGIDGTAKAEPEPLCVGASQFKDVAGGDVEKAHEHLDEHGPSAGAVLLMVVLSVHSVFEGVVIGTAGSASTIWLLTVVVVAHKWAAAFAITNQLTEKQEATRQTLSLLSVFVFASPVGILLGMIVSDVLAGVAAAVTKTIFNTLGVGTLLYVGMTEVVPEEFTGSVIGCQKLLVFLASAAGIAILTWIHEVSAHGGHAHGHGFDDDEHGAPVAQGQYMTLFSDFCAGAAAQCRGVGHGCWPTSSDKHPHAH